MNIIERFTKFVLVDPKTQCWNWQGGKHEYGYGQFQMKINGKWRAVQGGKAAWLIFRGVVPEGMQVRHKCDNPACVNPEHLELGTHKQNMGDRHTRKTHPFSAKTHCKNGHEFTPENTYLWVRSSTNTVRKCRQCRRDSMTKKESYVTE